MDISVVDLSLVPVVIGLIEVLKKTGLSSRFAPVASLILGVVGVWFFQDNVKLVTGLVVGLSASGLWSGVKAVSGN